MRDFRLYAYTTLIGSCVGVLSFVLLIACEWLLYVVIRPSYEGEEVFNLLALMFGLLVLFAASSLIIGILAGVFSYRRMTRARAGGLAEHQPETLPS